MNNLTIAVDRIKNCHLCDGKGVYTWSNGEDYDFEDCVCNTYGIILDDDGDVIWDNGLLSEPELLMSMEAN